MPQLDSDVEAECDCTAAIAHEVLPSGNVDLNQSVLNV